MNTVYKLLFAVLLSCNAFQVIAKETVQHDQQHEKLETFVNSERHYSLQYPSEWKRTDVPQIDLVLFSPNKMKDGKPASMNIFSEKVGEGISLDQFYTESAANLTSALKEVHVEKSGNVQINGINSKWIQYTHAMKDITFRVLQYFIVANDTLFLLTFSSAADDFEHYRNDFENIANSFKILTEASSTKTNSVTTQPATQNEEPVPAK
jgi:hypothetical protein